MHVYDNEKILKGQFEAKKSYETKIKLTIKLRDQRANFTHII